MTCYLRNMDWLLEALDVADDAHGRRAVDTALRAVFHLGPDAHCPQVWTAVKALSADERAGLPALVAAELEDPRADQGPSGVPG